MANRDNMADTDVLDECEEGQITPSQETKVPKGVSYPGVNGEINADGSKGVANSRSGDSKKRKKKKKVKKELEGDAKDGSLSPPAASSGVPVQNFRQLQNLQKTFELLRVTDQHKPAKTIEEATKKTYNFWETQPVPKIGKLCCLRYLRSL